MCDNSSQRMRNQYFSSVTLSMIICLQLILDFLRNAVINLSLIVSWQVPSLFFWLHKAQISSKWPHIDSSEKCLCIPLSLSSTGMKGPSCCPHAEPSALHNPQHTFLTDSTTFCVCVCACSSLYFFKCSPFASHHLVPVCVIVVCHMVTQPII